MISAFGAGSWIFSLHSTPIRCGSNFSAIWWNRSGNSIRPPSDRCGTGWNWYLLPISEVIAGSGAPEAGGSPVAGGPGPGGRVEHEEANWLEHRLDQGLPLGGAERWLDWFYDPPGALPDYLPEDTLWIWVDPLSLARVRASEGDTPWEEFFAPFARQDHLLLEDLPIEAGGRTGDLIWDLSSTGNQDISQKLQGQPSSRQALAELSSLLSGWLELGQEIWLVVSQEHQAKRLKDILTFYHLNAAVTVERRAAFAGEGPGLHIVTGRLSAGFRLKSPALLFIVEEEIFELKKEARKKGPRRTWQAYISSLDDLQAGDLVVHREHGIGRYQGLQRFSIDGLEGEFLYLEYAEGRQAFSAGRPAPGDS